MKIGYDREKSEEYGRKFGIAILNTDDRLAGLPVAGHKAIDGLIESAKAAGLDNNDTENKEGYLVVPVEYPLVSTRVMRAVMAAVTMIIDREGSCGYARATFEGKKGFPVFVPADRMPGGRADLSALPEDMLMVPVDEEGCMLRSDTPEGYADIRAFVDKGYAREKLELLTARKKIFLVCCGESDSLSDDIAQAMMEDVEAEALGMDKFGKEPMPAIERIYSCSQNEARETADTIRRRVNAMLPDPVDVRSVSGLDDIDEAEESIYDMQYRVIGAFRELLRNDDAKDIIIVAHSAVIRALENNIKGLRVDDQWEPIKKGSFRMFEPFPEQPSEKVHGDKPMNMNDMIMDSVLDYYD